MPAMGARKSYAIIGAGPAGLAAARNLAKLKLPFVGFELGPTVGGLWNIDNPRNTMYRSAHLISSKRMTAFKECPMARNAADYPRHTEVFIYFQPYASHFGMAERYRFNTEVIALAPIDDDPSRGWWVTSRPFGHGPPKPGRRPSRAS
jgi:cation diffusion facilitator CzcD-associated flavoprotein CzcO